MGGACVILPVPFIMIGSLESIKKLIIIVIFHLSRLTVPILHCPGCRFKQSGITRILIFPDHFVLLIRIQAFIHGDGFFPYIVIDRTRGQGIFLVRHFRVEFLHTGIRFFYRISFSVICYICLVSIPIEPHYSSSFIPVQSFQI